MNSITKGKVGEREARDVFRSHGYEARRGQQFAGGPDSPDIITDLPIHVEVKRVEKLNLQDATDQAGRDSGGKDWVVMHRRNHSPWLFTVSEETFFRLVRGDFAEPNKWWCESCKSEFTQPDEHTESACPKCHGVLNKL